MKQSKLFIFLLFLSIATPTPATLSKKIQSKKDICSRKKNRILNGQANISFSYKCKNINGDGDKGGGKGDGKK